MGKGLPLLSKFGKQATMGNFCVVSFSAVRLASVPNVVLCDKAEHILPKMVTWKLALHEQLVPVVEIDFSWHRFRSP